MKTIQTNARYVEWLSADEMHNESKEWLSQLEFVKDEHLFFEDLIKSYTLQLIHPEKFAHNKEIIDAINKSQKQNNYLIKAIIVHESKLQILVDGINQPKEERRYRNEHKALINRINDHLKHYRSLKSQLFDIVKKIKKEEKIGLLIDKR
ncbi:hypothetical protein [uncultured Winogradskyella sp.]|uniref:hypothetical protein n=1 Tax=uncultured Winogradskyella sp. TaxID=395353 RepID=UPI002604CF63|nr:hypothetical protein [uncultured Winogradskyella sp.]